MRRSLGVLVFLAGCASVPPEPPPETFPDWARRSDRMLIEDHGAFGNYVDIEVDWFAQTPPDDLALVALQMVASREAEGGPVRIRKSTEIPAARWKSCKGDRIETLLDECRDRKKYYPSAAYVHILYCPFNPWGDKAASNGLCRRLEKPFPHWQIFIFKGTLNSRQFLSLTADKLDRSCLVHEYGHALGLVSNPSHRFEDGGGHCVDTGCVMTKPKLKAILDNAVKTAVTGEIPWDFCDTCRRDLQTARRAWRSSR